MDYTTFNALPVVADRTAALVLSAGTYFLFAEDEIQQNNAFAPDSNRIMYLQRTFIRSEDVGSYPKVTSQGAIGYARLYDVMTGGVFGAPLTAPTP